MSADILVVVEHDGAQPDAIALEALALGFQQAALGLHLGAPLGLALQRGPEFRRKMQNAQKALQEFDMQFDSFIGAFAPVKVPPAIISLLSREMSAALANPEIRQRFAASGVETIGSTPQALAEAVQSERARLGKLIRDLNLKPD